MMHVRDVISYAGVVLVVSGALVLAQPEPAPPLPPDVPPVVTPLPLPPSILPSQSVAAIILAFSGLASATLPQFAAAWRSWLDDRRLERETAKTYLEERALGREADMRRIGDRLDALEGKVFGPGPYSGNEQEGPPP